MLPRVQTLAPLLDDPMRLLPLRDVIAREQTLPSLNLILWDAAELTNVKSMETWMKDRQEQLEELNQHSLKMESMLAEVQGVVEDIKRTQLLPRRPVLPQTPLSQLPDLDSQELALVLIDFPALPLYVKRRFSIHFKLVNRAGEVQSRDAKIICRLSVHKMTDRGEEIKRTRTGTPLIKGSQVKTFQPDQELILQNLMFKDISGHFPQGRVNLLIRMLSNPSIKPLFIEGIRVKARKKRPDEVI